MRCGAWPENLAKICNGRLPGSDEPSEMRLRPRYPDDRTTDRLLAGVVDTADAPPGFAGTAHLLGRAAGEFTPIGADADFVSVLATTIATPPVAPRRKSMFAKLLTAKAAAAAAAVVLSATTAAAATGSLPEAAQTGAAKAADHLGINLPNPSEDHPTGTADNPTVAADGHGDDVSGTARDPEPTGADKGAAVSDEAKGDHGQSPDATDDTEDPAATGVDDNPAKVDTPNPGGTDTADGASDGASETGTTHAP